MFSRRSTYEGGLTGLVEETNAGPASVPTPRPSKRRRKASGSKPKRKQVRRKKK